MLPPDPKKMMPQKAADTTHDHGGLVSASDPATAMMPAPPPAAVTAPPGLGTMLHALRRCCWWALPLALVAGLAASAISWFLFPGSYASVILFKINPRSTAGSQEDEGHFSNVQREYSSYLKSHETLDEAIRKSEVAEKYGVNETPQTLAKRMTIAFNDGPEVMMVTLSGENPEALAAILNALGEIYPTRLKQQADERVKARIAVLRARLDSSDKRDPGRATTLAELLYDKRQELSKAEKDAGLDDTTVKSKLRTAQDAFTLTRETLSAKKRELSSAQARRAAIASPRRVRPPPVSAIDLEEQLSRSTAHQKALKAIDKIEAEIDYARRNYSGKAYERAVAGLPEALEEWRAEERRLRRNAEQKLQNKLTQQAATEQQQIDDAYDRAVNEAKALEAGLAKEIETLEKDLASRRREMEEAQVNGSKITPEIQALRDQEKQLVKEQDAVGSEIAGLEQQLSQPPRVRKHADAYVPQERDTSRSMKIALGVGILTMLCVLGGLCLMEATGRRIYSSGDVLQGLGMRIIGTLPRLPSSARRKTAAAQALGGLDHRYGMNEAVDAIRTLLLHSPRTDGARVVLITSAIGGEGKTSLASHLAVSLARAWRKTLLIDGDLRKPALQTQFDLPLEPGFSEALRGEIEFDDAVKPTMTSRLWLMPAGKVDGHSLQALAQEALAGVFEQLKEQYDFIVVDTSPVLLVPDGLLLAQQADAVLLAVMRDHSRLPAVYAAQQKLASLGIAVLGGVMIGEKTEAYGHAVPYPKS